MKRKRSQPSSIASIIGKNARKMNIERRMDIYRLTKAWPEIVGPAICAHTSPERLLGKTLLVRVDGSSWMNELVYFKKEITKKIGARIPELKIQDLKFEIGEIRRMSSEKNSEENASRERNLTEEELDFIKIAADEISDPETKSIAESAMKRSFKRMR
ncbi:MAG TPA: DUF721 domain-containing protein [bacterium]|nr:DUF721 domain-containing protein [Myxococcales bacterium]OQA62301.1 MAG: hypothetical protein BWY40_00082 [bacterium ADurb.Bin270]HPW45045.1 DUF721 domain-containing protein [bacterium]HQG12917.1 DUF721 domain-containing protein [bacterium]